MKIKAKESELDAMRIQLEQERHKYALITHFLSLYSEHSRYEEMLGLKLGLDTEIAVYRALLDTEEKRVARSC